METNESTVTKGDLVTALDRLRPAHYEEILTVIEILEQVRGDATPGEWLLTSLLIDHRVAGRLTPEIVRREVEAFEENWRDLAELARYVQRHHPELFELAAAARNAA